MATPDSELERLHALVIDRLGSSGARPTLLEALWDGDTQGWMLDLYLTLRDPEGGEERLPIACLRYGSDIRLFSGAVPPWPESEVAKLLGERLEREFGCELWFPSPDAPDDDAPAFAERERAIACADCSKLIIPTSSPYLPKDVCYSCHLRREQRAELLREPGEGTARRRLSVAIEGQAPSYDIPCREDSEMYRLLALADPTQAVASDHRLDAEAVARFAEAAALEVERLLESPVGEPMRGPQWPRMEAEWRGRSFELELQGNPAHRRLFEAIGLAEFGEEARSRGRAIEVFTNIGIKIRDGHLLGQLLVHGGEANRAELRERHREDFGSSEAVDEAIARLEGAGCVRLEGERVEATHKAQLLRNSPEEG